MDTIARPTLARMLRDALDDGGSLLLIAGAGYGKTTALEEALDPAERRSVWVSCSGTGGDAGRLLVALVDELRGAVPGLADVLADRLAAGVEAVDVPAAARALRTDLERMLPEPLVIVVDDAEEVEGSADALLLLDELVNVRGPLSVAIATRRALTLRLAKLRAAGRVRELGPAELAFSASECEQLLRMRRGAELTDTEVEAAIASSEGWPMGVALAGLAGPGAPGDTVARDELFRYLAEEVLDRLEPSLRLALVDSSVPATLTPQLVDALDLPADFLERTQSMGLFLRPAARGGSYHPLFREFLLGRLTELRDADAVAALHARAAAELSTGEDVAEAVHHWLEAGHFDEALATLAAKGSELIRTSPETVREWLARLPGELRRDPAYLLIEGQLEWGVGRHERAIDPLRGAIAGYRAKRDRAREWLARSFLADALSSAGAFEDVLRLSQGWDGDLGGAAAVSALAVAWYAVIALTILGRGADAAALVDRLHRDAPAAAQFRYLEDIARVAQDPAAGRGGELADELRETIADLERHDPHARLPYALAMLVLVLQDLGEVEAAMSCLDRCERESERAGVGFVARDSQLQRAFLLARQGDLSRAELDLARAGPRRGAGWRGVNRHKAEAQVAALRGDAGEAVAAAERALERVAPGPVCFCVWAAVDMAPVLAANGARERAGAAVADARSRLDELFPGATGRVHRARLLATRSWLEYDAGDRDAARATVAECLREAGPQADQVVRAHWTTLRPVVWDALAAGSIEPESILPALQTAMPRGEALVALADHPVAGVRRAGAEAALAANHPAVVSKLDELRRDGDPGVAAAAEATRERLRDSPPARRFDVLGRFRLRWAGWEMDDSGWGRPMDARLVRLLLVHLDHPVPEDLIFEALWPTLSVESARRSLQVSVSRARRVLDPPGADRSALEASGQAYRLVLGPHDTVDAEEFLAAAAHALDDRGGDRARPLLERARSLWEGEPMPEERYSDWATGYRERLLDRYAGVLTALTELHEASGRHVLAADSARELVQLDPLNEGGHRALIRAYARTGRTGHSLRQYLECRRTLVENLGIEPAEATSQLQARVLAGEAV